jgi:hypothetical protein
MALAPAEVREECELVLLESTRRQKGGEGGGGKRTKCEKEEEDVVEDEEFNDKVQHPVPALPVEEMPTKKAKSVRPTIYTFFRIYDQNLLRL